VSTTDIHTGNFQKKTQQKSKQIWTWKFFF